MYLRPGRGEDRVTQGQSHTTRPGPYARLYTHPLSRNHHPQQPDGWACASGAEPWSQSMYHRGTIRTASGFHGTSPTSFELGGWSDKPNELADSQDQPVCHTKSGKAQSRRSGRGTRPRDWWRSPGRPMGQNKADEWRSGEGDVDLREDP